MYDDLAKGDVVRLRGWKSSVMVTDVPQPYEGMTETLFVYTADYSAGANTFENLGVTDRSEIAESHGPYLHQLQQMTGRYV